MTKFEARVDARAKQGETVGGGWFAFRRGVILEQRRSWCEPNYPAWQQVKLAVKPVNENGPTAKDCQKNRNLKGCSNG